MKKELVAIFCLIGIVFSAFGQKGYWQQQIKYTMDVDMDVETNKFSGRQKILYINNSPDALKKLFFHLYLNAFQPGSSMDVRSRHLGKVIVNGKPDWDTRIKDTLQGLNPSEIGYQKITSLKVNGQMQNFVYHGTILEVQLAKPLLPGTTTTIDINFDAQVPLQIRRTGRDNPKTGVRYSMAQWYPKLCEYDKHGWNPNPYIAREFYGVWGDFDVSINIDKNYKLGATGELVNAAEIGWGYDKPGTALKPIVAAKRKWRFVAKNVHDFVWAADQDYVHYSKKVVGGPMLHVLYKDKPGDDTYQKAWQNVLEAAGNVLPFMEKNYGKYPYPQYSFIHGGDGGMEYPMVTLISGNSPGLIFHEWMHSWYQMMLGTNESLYHWMDEGFTSFAEDAINCFYQNKTSLEILQKSLEAKPDKSIEQWLPSLPQSHSEAYANYFNLVKSRLEEPLSTHADHFNTNYAYGKASYTKGEVFLEQLGYITGAQVRDKILLEYYNRWKFKHPTPDDFMKVAEDVSGMKLDWYKQYWVYTTKTINYAIDSLWQSDAGVKLRLRRLGLMPMPIDVLIKFKDGREAMHHIPLNLMFAAKLNEGNSLPLQVNPYWDWVNPDYTLDILGKLTDIAEIEIDPSRRMADVDRSNNKMKLGW